jgi:hypothetical protein
VERITADLFIARPSAYPMTLGELLKSVIDTYSSEGHARGAAEHGAAFFGTLLSLEIGTLTSQCSTDIAMPIPHTPTR